MFGQYYIKIAQKHPLWCNTTAVGCGPTTVLCSSHHAHSLNKPLGVSRFTTSTTNVEYNVGTQSIVIESAQCNPSSYGKDE